MGIKSVATKMKKVLNTELTWKHTVGFLVVGWLVVFLLTYAIDATAAPTAHVTYDTELVHTRTGEEFQVKMFIDVDEAVDRVVFSRWSLAYDSTIVQCVGIDNGTDVPAGAYSEPFVNWDGYSDAGANIIYLGMWYQPMCAGSRQPPYDDVTCEKWEGHAITYTFRAVGPGRTTIKSVEYGLRMNYLDMQPWMCEPGYTAEYTTDPNGTQDCFDPATDEEVMVVSRGPRVPKIKIDKKIAKAGSSMVWNGKSLEEWALMGQRYTHTVPVPFWTIKTLYK